MQSNTNIKVVWRTNHFVVKISGAIVLLSGLLMIITDLSDRETELMVGFYIKAGFNVFFGMAILFNELGAELDLEEKRIREYFHLVFYRFHTPWRNMNNYKYVLIKEVEPKCYKVFLKISTQKVGKEIMTTKSIDESEVLADHISDKMKIEVRKLLLK